MAGFATLTIQCADGMVAAEAGEFLRLLPNLLSRSARRENGWWTDLSTEPAAHITEVVELVHSLVEDYGYRLDVILDEAVNDSSDRWRLGPERVRSILSTLTRLEANQLQEIVFQGTMAFPENFGVLLTIVGAWQGAERMQKELVEHITGTLRAVAKQQARGETPTVFDLVTYRHLWSQVFREPTGLDPATYFSDQLCFAASFAASGLSLQQLGPVDGLFVSPIAAEILSRPISAAELDRRHRQA